MPSDAAQRPDTFQRCRHRGVVPLIPQMVSCGTLEASLRYSSKKMTKDWYKAAQPPDSDSCICDTATIPQDYHVLQSSKPPSRNNAAMAVEPYKPKVESDAEQPPSYQLKESLPATTFKNKHSLNKHSLNKTTNGLTDEEKAMIEGQIQWKKTHNKDTVQPSRVKAQCAHRRAQGELSEAGV